MTYIPEINPHPKFCNCNTSLWSNSSHDFHLEFWLQSKRLQYQYSLMNIVYYYYYSTQDFYKIKLASCIFLNAWSLCFCFLTKIHSYKLGYHRWMKALLTVNLHNYNPHKTLQRIRDLENISDTQIPPWFKCHWSSRIKEFSLFK